MSGKHAGGTAIIAIKCPGGHAVPDANGDPSCECCGWAPGREAAMDYLNGRGGMPQIGAVGLITKIHPRGGPING